MPRGFREERARSLPGTRYTGYLREGVVRVRYTGSRQPQINVKLSATQFRVSTERVELLAIGIVREHPMRRDGQYMYATCTEYMLYLV
jgi:hypothetical protein